MFEGITAEIDLVATSKLKIVLLREDFYYQGNWTGQVTEVL